MKISKSEDGLAFYVQSEGFPYGDFNKAGKVDIWRILKHFEIGRATILGLALHKDFQINSANSVFVRYQTVEIFPEFYLAADVSNPWLMKTNLGYVGKTSYWIEGATRCTKTGTLIAQSSCQAVRVNRLTRRPVELPADGAAKYRASALKNLPQGLVFPVKIPKKEQSFIFTTKAVPSETDTNDHVNQSVCFKYCHDAASLAAVQGNILSKFSQDLAYYNVKTFSVEYVGEMNAGDDIDVQCWEDEMNHCVLYFIIRVRQQIACKCRGEWYSNQNGELVVKRGRINLHASL